MKHLTIFIILLIILSCGKKELAKTRFYVRGNCEMCQERIEKTAKKVKGVAKASWNVDTKMLTVAYDSTEVQEIEIHKAVAAVGHGTEKVEMNKEAHDALPSCCQVQPDKEGTNATAYFMSK